MVAIRKGNFRNLLMNYFYLLNFVGGIQFYLLTLPNPIITAKPYDALSHPYGL